LWGDIALVEHLYVGIADDCEHGGYQISCGSAPLALIFKTLNGS
jgi:hypothetical protein